jgi:hypothetical protein
VSLVAGVAAIIFGIVALAKTGIHGDSLRSPDREVWSFHHTPLLAVVEIGFGVLLVLAAVSAGTSRTIMALLGALAVAFGVVILADAWPARMHRWFGVHHRNGWLFVITGGVVLLAGLLLPTFSRPETRAVREVHHERRRTEPDMSDARA